MRVSVYYLLTFLLLGGCQLSKDQSTPTKLTEKVSSLYEDDKKPFYHGVASGDPLTDRVIIWTRVTPDDSVPSIDVSWEIASNKDFDPILKKETVSTSPSRDYTVKVDVDGLKPNTKYFYRFTALEKTSATGLTRTLPDSDVDSLKFAVVSCSNWQHGYFNAYDRIAERQSMSSWQRPCKLMSIQIP